MVKQYDIYWVNLDPTVGSEIKKTRPCLVITPTFSNKILNTILVAPITSTIRNFPMRVSINLKSKSGQIALDQIRCVDKSRLFDRIESLDKESIQKLKSILSEYLIE
ncbi:type II toxin-antitoxin system PemK/MazF family toxin [Aequorivita echinoideorum]|uniref:mRNA interferase n=1 Tax=Aequorivita echinoideorum TaxID=1549647 RepID=A0ABS5S1E9_9FLAO|nr:type II toxin-antitoxin system PemK/MazF family toxin [Aequorivita echinoideorum]MBT0607036.1 type II toxin-antitoxin system PemK/MazF family toxin [Aequorivita echinoideorum]